MDRKQFSLGLRLEPITTEILSRAPGRKAIAPMPAFIGFEEFDEFYARASLDLILRRATKKTE